MKHIFLKQGRWLAMQKLGVASICLLFSACEASKVKTDAINAELRDLNKKVDSSQNSSQALLESVELMLEKQAELEPQFEKLQNELSAIKRAQKLAQPPEQRDETKAEVAVPVAEESQASEKLVLGRVEWLWLAESQRYFAVQIGTGVDISLVCADEIMQFERDGEKWIQFTIERNDWPSEISAKIKRSEKVKHFSGSSVRGYVIDLPVQIADFNDELEFAVVDKKASYPQIVLGKNFLTDVAVVDVSEKYLHKKTPDSMKVESEARELYQNKSRQDKAENTESTSVALDTP